MGFSALTGSSTNWNWTYIAIDGTASSPTTKQMLKYTNDTDKKQVLKSVYFNMGTGNGTFQDSQVVTGYGVPYDVYVYVTQDSKTIKSDTLTITNKVSPSYSGYEEKTFTFTQGIPVEAGASVIIYMALIRTDTSSSYPVVICHGRNNSSYWGGTVTDQVASMLVWNGSVWKECVPLVWNGSTWKECVALVWNGSVWKNL